jgi:uncharacterized protein YjbJ (UPF0337 family)
MSTLQLRGNWNIIQGKLKQEFPPLTDDDLQLIEGKENELIGRIQKRTGPAKQSHHPNKLHDNLRATKFHLRAPEASSVKLAADFTRWDETPLEMSKDAKGTWVRSVLLLPGEYAYRFIVDGEWSNDPLASHSLPNQYGTANSVKRVRFFDILPVNHL